MSVKKSIIAASALVLAVSVAVGGTFAYNNGFEGNVKSAMNVMEYGKGVSIEIVEQQRANGDNSELEAFEQGKALYPIIGGAQNAKDKWGMPETATAKNFVDKIVRVQNTGEADAYIRFFFAVPVGALGDNTPTNDVIHTSWGNRFDATGLGKYNTGDGWKTDWGWLYESNDEIRTEIDGILYEIDTFVYDKAIAPGEITSAALAGVYMDSRVDYVNGEYTFDGKVVNLDFTQQFVLPVFAQAVNAELGDTAAEAFANAGMPDNPWNDYKIGTAAYDADSLTEAVAVGGTVTLAGDVTITDDSADAKNVITKDADVYLGNNVITLDIPDATSATANWVGLNVDGGNVTLNANGGGITTADNGELYGIVVRNGATLTINGGTYIGGTTAAQVSAGTLNITGGFFQAQTDDQRYVINCIDSAYGDGSAKIVITGGTFVNFNPNEVVGSEDYVPEGYTVVEEPQANGDIWYTVVAE